MGENLIEIYVLIRREAKHHKRERCNAFSGKKNGTSLKLLRKEVKFIFVCSHGVNFKKCGYYLARKVGNICKVAYIDLLNLDLLSETIQSKS